ncbi:3-oxoacyl-[acyl-carrier protein] reductase [Albimonas donghaensis]|uniref:3-oxoacyl-[acyl-carrier protein] reductase n=1 Tax=Albimonas donghaensis TaxID=356660 RepID=A0A1H2VIS8_9RHOB|nr:3-oxoacyl-ACP reductase FabG [Albimonas donghaensis]MBR29053.1 3-oxoacyl-ACP reductase FabG [Paracoccaceae bacterium]SDW67799.1 3-oxoacyl-[acyl-carrier protein] reductase [Albimonas donghaensis]
MDLGIKGKVVAITGGGGAIGSTTARMFAEEGAKVALLDINREGAEAAAAEIAAAGGTAIGLEVDILDKAAVTSAFARAEAELGPIDVLVNNAGFSRDKYMTKMEESDWDIVHGVVLKGTFHCCRAVLPGMMQRRWGRIVNITSMSYQGNAGQTNYSSAKAGLVGLTAALAREAGPFNITVNAVAPALVATPRLRARKDFDKLEQRSKALTPLPRLSIPEDIAKAVIFHASSMADFVSAQVMHVSGGR